MFTIDYTKAFLRDVKKYYDHGGTEEKIERVLRLLEEGSPLPAALHDHQLKGKLRQFRELHVEPDWLLVYEKDGKKLSIVCIWLVSHKQLQERQRTI